jgi:hypothetical protein
MIAREIRARKISFAFIALQNAFICFHRRGAVRASERFKMPSIVLIAPQQASIFSRAVSVETTLETFPPRAAGAIPFDFLLGVAQSPRA